ncbi:phospholipase D-like domain-containing protein [Sphingobium bisphenolivorans]|uniref:phospholipase D-like domain-containing protein n=1 Tax=Sphingobium bisphenolivorans TaxID=1335760 RepID=UPI00039EC0DB|nr:phosphatidylserine/phosphatidylglycerophosphate/cardiolipin synthase family protein [Sphingobium bisphenolivorans]
MMKLKAEASDEHDSRMFFGGPDQPRRLRDLLEERINAVPAGGEILWVTYYLRDERLAAALVRAHRRGVNVKVAVEGAPRLKSANSAVIRLLQDRESGIGSGLRVVHRALFRHLHEKLYCFSHPRPVALVGSFNPSGNEPEDERVIGKIGDQDRGHNYLVELAGAEVGPLMDHARQMHECPRLLFQRFVRHTNETVVTDSTTIYFFPRLGNPLPGRLDALQAGSRLRIAVSHLRDGSIADLLVRLAKRGVHVELLTEATTRRVPRRIEKRILAGGVSFRRFHHPQGFPMHSKFLLAEGPGERWAAFGSFNLTLTSRWLNNELLAISKDEALFDAFARRWDAMQAHHDGQGGRP